MADLKRKSIHGGMVTMASQGISILVQLASTVILARLLSPDDYGTIAMVMALTSFAGLFRDLGLSAAAIQKKDLTHSQQSNLFWLNVAMGAALTALVAAAAPLLAWFYGKPELVAVTIALSFNFIIGSLGSQHGTRLVRDMRFARQAAATISGALVSLAVSFTLALQGLAYWALVWGGLAGAVTTTTLLWLVSPFRPGGFKPGAGIRQMVGFGANITAFDVVNYLTRNLDNILIGRFWGPGALGIYSRAYALLMLPINSIRAPLVAVAFPAMSGLQNDPAAFRAYYLKTTSLIALLSMPLAAFLFSASRPIVELILGARWLEVSPVFSCLAVAAFIQPASGFAGSLLLSLGQGRRYLSCGIFNSLLFIACFSIGVSWGPMGVAISFSIGTYLGLVPWLWWAFRESPVSLMDFFKACVAPAAVALAGLLATQLFKLAAIPLDPIPELAILSAMFATGACACFAASKSVRIMLFDLRQILNSFKKH
jgi:PST family polysaccharide transporter